MPANTAAWLRKKHGRLEAGPAGRPCHVCPRWFKSAVVYPGCCTRYGTGMAPHSCNSVFLLLAVSYVPKYEINRYDWRITNMPSRSLGIARRRLHSAKISRIFYLQDKCRNSAAAPGVPASSPKPSALCRSAMPEPDGKGSVVWPRLDGKGHLPEAGGGSSAFGRLPLR